MFIAQAYAIRHEFWRYLIGSLIVFFGSLIGQIPFTVAVLAKGGLSSIQDQASIMRVLEPNLNLFLLLISFAFGMIALLVVVRFLHGQSFKSVTTSRPKIDFKRVFFAFGLVAVLIAGSTVLDYKLSPEDYEWNFKLGPFLILCVIAIALVPIQTSLEEYLFRGYLMQGFGTLAGNRWFPLVMTSVIFGMLHIANPEVEKMGYIIMFYYIGTGFMLGIMTLMDEGMELALGYHAANNLVTALLVTADWTAFQTHSVLKDMSDPAVGFDIFIPMLVMYPIILLIFARVYKWKNWKDKLFGKVERPISVELEEIGQS